jgi:hypothetical protein
MVFGIVDSQEAREQVMKIAQKEAGDEYDLRDNLVVV